MPKVRGKEFPYTAKGKKAAKKFAKHKKRQVMATQSEKNLAVIANDLEYIKRDIAEIKESVTHNYVTKEEFDPYKKIVYALIGLILTGVVGSLLSLVLR